MQLGPSELILNPDNSIYHLHLLPEDLAETIITVGDPDRVCEVSKYFDIIEVEKRHREFTTHTGTLEGKRFTVISTGIGTDNIDIVLNELDALVNIDFDSRTFKEEPTQLDIIRIGSSGAIQPDIPLDSFLLSTFAIGFDSLLHFYESAHIQQAGMQLAFMDHTGWSAMKSVPYIVKGNTALTRRLESKKIIKGITATNPGFYGPQGRKLRLAPDDPGLNEKLATFVYDGMKITNLEMETSGIFGLSALLGHRAASLNCILANRSTGEFSLHPERAMDDMIRFTLDQLL